MGFRRTAIILALLFLALPLQAWRHENICGTVRDQSGAVLPAATAELSAGDTHLNAKEDSAVRFFFEYLEAGEYECAVKAQGFRTFRQDVIVQPGESVRLTVALSP